ncbi:tellurite resistance TerB family protein [Plectonema cf. radiosum LEGE 06105]|uniref:Tellurite resistance TerB family protein n=1 Tax=Plectonema cf. radiosum LEGE 06105 TaxID=945769 RepID=A0A8J7EYV8_9CYAN|nr:tellurite resistance TerB family protein [Plectonema radiosum]MBE9211170.1 tellurite resistance TerB family protein [Plectonema cf. radiosum LEGE 06105]
MGKYDKFFSSKKTLKESLTPEEAVAAIALVTTVADSSLEDVDIEFLVDILWGFEIFEEYSDEDLLEMLDKLLNLAEQQGAGALFNAANDKLEDEFLEDAFAAGVSVIIDEEEMHIPKSKTPLLKSLQQALELDDEEAQEIIEDVIAAFEEAELEELLEDEDETIVDIAFSIEEYESPSDNFTVPIPVDPHQGGKVQSQEGAVSFSDDQGTFLRIDYYPLPTKQMEEMEAIGQEEYLKSTLVNKYVPKEIVANLPEAEVEYSEYMAKTLEGSYFVLLYMPGGSRIYKTGNNGTATKLDAYRGLIAFINGEFLYIVSSQRTFLDGKTPSFMKEEAVALKQIILDFIDTIDFN